MTELGSYYYRSLITDIMLHIVHAGMRPGSAYPLSDGLT